MNEKEIRYFSMFSGVGGFELGLSANNVRGTSEECSKDERLQPSSNQSHGRGRGSCSFSCVGLSEIDKYASELLSKRFPNIPNFGDCTKIDPSKLPDFDMLCGGFPCQSFSIAGKRRGFEDTRGTMFFEVARILKVKRPKIVLLENVKGLLNHNKGETFKVILQTLDELGYEVQWMVLNSKFFGVPQNRERVFIIGSLRGERRPEILPFRKSNGELDEKSIQKLCGSSPSPIFTVSDSERTRREIQSRYSIRRLTPKECERLQGFPDDWTLIEQDNEKMMSDTQRYKMMGNAVTTKVISAIANKLLMEDK